MKEGRRADFLSANATQGWVSRWARPGGMIGISGYSPVATDAGEPLSAGLFISGKFYAQSA